MKKTLSIILAVLMIFGMTSVLAFADQKPKTKTETFIEGIKDGSFSFKGQITADVIGTVDILAAVKGNKAGAQINVLNKDVKLTIDNGSITAYISNIFKADVSQLAKEFTGENIELFDFNELTENIPDFGDFFQYLNATYENDGKVEVLKPDKSYLYQDLQTLIASKISDQTQQQAVMQMGENDFWAYCESLKAGDPGKTEYDVAMACGGRVTFENADGKKLIDATIKYPNDTFTALDTFDMSDIRTEGIKIDYISTEASDSEVGAPGGIFGLYFDITWLISLFGNFIIEQLGGI